jgi:hypothetical protein
MFAWIAGKVAELVARSFSKIRLAGDASDGGADGCGARALCGWPLLAYAEVENE